MLKKPRKEPPPAPSPPLLEAPRLPASDEAVLKSKIAELQPWFHNMNLAEGVWTNPSDSGPGQDYPASRWNRIAPLLPEVKGKRCLDVGCSSGFFSLKLKQCGASSVLGIDHGEQVKAIAQARFASDWLGLSASFETMSVYDIGKTAEKFDLILFMGIFYHLRHPLLALEALRQVCSGSLILQTITTPHRQGTYEPCPPPRNIDSGLRSPSLNKPDFPLLRFVEGGLDGDTSCWFIPSIEAVLALLRSAGFTPEKMILPDRHEIIVRAS